MAWDITNKSRTVFIKPCGGGAIVDLPVELKSEIGALKLKNADGSEQTLDQLVNNLLITSSFLIFPSAFLRAVRSSGALRVSIPDKVRRICR
jgi:hypothetical protein